MRPLTYQYICAACTYRCECYIQLPAPRYRKTRPTEMNRTNRNAPLYVVVIACVNQVTLDVALNNPTLSHSLIIFSIYLYISNYLYIYIDRYVCVCASLFFSSVYLFIYLFPFFGLLRSSFNPLKAAAGGWNKTTVAINEY